ncbi:MAG: DUF1003 domain-containing protein [Patescibacteria group bacterium]
MADQKKNNISEDNNVLGGGVTPESATVQRINKRRRVIKSFESEVESMRTPAQKVADWIAALSGNIAFAIFHVIWFSFWVVANLGYIPDIKPFDPYPFGLLTMIVSLEAIFLSIFVLMSQNRQTQINDLREEVHLRVNLIAEEEVTKVLDLLARVYRHLNIPEEKDPELDRMLRPLNTKEIEEQLRAQLNIKR